MCLSVWISVCDTHPVECAPGQAVHTVAIASVIVHAVGHLQPAVEVLVEERSCHGRVHHSVLPGGDGLVEVVRDAIAQVQDRLDCVLEACPRHLQQDLQLAHVPRVRAAGRMEARRGRNGGDVHWHRLDGPFHLLDVTAQVADLVVRVVVVRLDAFVDGQADSHSQLWKEILGD